MAFDFTKLIQDEQKKQEETSSRSGGVGFKTVYPYNKIAEAEYIIQTSDDKKKIAKAQSEILELSGKVTSLEDMMLIDELIQDIFSEKFDF